MATAGGAEPTETAGAGAGVDRAAVTGVIEAARGTTGGAELVAWGEVAGVAELEANE